MTQGGKSTPVYIVTDEEIASGAFTVEAGSAIPISLLESTNRGVMGGNSTPIYIVDADYVGSHGIKDGLQALPVVDLTNVRPISSPHRAIPAYITHYDLLSFLFHDAFVTNEPAPLSSPRTAEPGPGILTITDTDNKASIASGALHLAPHSTPAGGDPGVWGGALARTCGRALLARVTLAAINTSVKIGWDSDQASTAQHNSLSFNSDGKIDPTTSGSTAAADTATYTTAQQDLAIILRAAGAYFLRRTSTDWDLLWADDTDTTATLYPAITNYNATLDADWLRVAGLPAPFNTQYGLATHRTAGAVAQGTTFTHEADFVMRFTLTTVSSGDPIYVRFRIQDATHYWYIAISSTGGLSLWEYNAGAINRINVAAGLSGGEVITVIADDTTIMVYYGSTQAGSYNSAANFKTETDGVLFGLGTGGAIADLVTYPRTMSGAAKTALDLAAI